MICGHHIYKDVEQEAHNAEDCFAVAVVKDGKTIVDHVAYEVSRLGTSLNTMEL